MEARADAFLLTREEACERYRISMRTLVRLYARYRDFPVVRIGRRVLIIRDEAEQWLREHRDELILE